MERLKRVFGLVCLCTFGIIAAVFCIPSFATDSLVAPIRNPLVCAYFRLQESYEQISRDLGQNGGSTSVGEPGKSPTATFLRSVGSTLSRFRASVREATGRKGKGKAVVLGEGSDPVPLLGHFAKTGVCLPQDLLIYFKSPGEYLFLILGSCSPKAFQPLFDPAMVLPRPDGFSVSGTNRKLQGRQPLLHFGNRFIFLCPAEIEGNILDALAAEQDNLGEKFKTFRGMARIKPVLALEADVAGLVQLLSGLGTSAPDLPFPLNQIQVFRLLVDGRMVKAQAFAPDEAGREALARVARDLTSAIKAWLSPSQDDPAGSGTGPEGKWASVVSSLRDFTEGTSVFIESSGLKESAVYAGIGALGLFSSLSLASLPIPTNTMLEVGQGRQEGASSAAPTDTMLEVGQGGQEGASFPAPLATGTQDACLVPSTSRLASMK